MVRLTTLKEEREPKAERFTPIVEKFRARVNARESSNSQGSYFLRINKGTILR